jgi:hypothetical protein
LNEARSLLARALELERALADGRTDADQPAPTRDRRSWAAQRIKNSVARPLQDAVTHLDPEHFATAPIDLPRADEKGKSTEAPSITEQIWQLAKDATLLSAQAGLPTEVTEATAALQHLACQFAERPDGEADTIARFKELQSVLPSGIRAQVNGPYLERMRQR